jgi:hypothetical protein
MSSLTAKAKRLMRAPKGVRIKKFEKGEGRTNDIIDVILYADKHSKADTARFSKVFEQWPIEKALEKLWRFVRKEIRYKADQRGYEVVKGPAQTWKDRQADCKSMSIFIGSVLQNLGIRYSFRFVSWKKSDPVSHVYIIAHTNKGDFILDAVYEKFNQEEGYAYKKDIRGMTQISYVHGIRSGNRTAARSIQDVLKPSKDGTMIDDAPKRAAPVRPFDIAALSDGQLNLMLLDRKLEILQTYYGDPSGEVGMARNMIFRAMTGGQGLHRSGSITGVVPDAVQKVAAHIVSAQKRTKPASLHAQGVKTLPAIGNLIKERDCFEWYAERVEEDFGEFYLEIPSHKRKEYEQCKKIQAWRTVLNRYYSNASHHLLYEFVTDVNQQPPVVVTKTIGHKNAIGKLSQDSGIARDNFKLWTETGILNENAKKQIRLITPEASIEYLRSGAGDPTLPSVALDPVTIAAIGKLVGILVTAISATTGLIQLLRRNQQARAIDQIAGYGTPSFSADPPDWTLSNSGPGSPGPNNDQGGFFKAGGIAPLLLAGAGAFLFLNPKMIK